MKEPKYAATTTQEMINVGVNGFAVVLLAESAAQKREELGDDTALLVGYGKDKQPVYILVSCVPFDFIPQNVVEALEKRYSK